MILALAAALVALAPLERPPGSAERRAVLDALRPAVEAKLGPNLEFVVSSMRVEGDWAFVMADPQRRGGKPIDGRAIFGDHLDNMDGIDVTAVLKRQRGGWTLVEHAIGATDVWYCDVGPRSLKKGLGC